MLLKIVLIISIHNKLTCRIYYFKTMLAAIHLCMLICHRKQILILNILKYYIMHGHDK